VSALLDVRGLCAGYGDAAVLHDVGLAVPDGSIVAVLGANGAGKTTLLRTVSGLLRGTKGTIVFDGSDTAGVPVERLARRGLAHVPEGRGIIDELTVEENLRLGGLWKSADHSHAYTLFPALAERRRHLGHQLSGGERQMLAVGRALVAQPRLLLLDEPSLGLAPRVAVLLVEQNVRSALSIADRGVVMSLGRVVVDADADDLRDDDRLRHAYLGF